VLLVATITGIQNLRVIKLYELAHSTENHYIFQVLQSSLLRKLAIENFPDQAAKAPHVCGTAKRQTTNIS
jgi:hypothetical protein